MVYFILLRLPYYSHWLRLFFGGRLDVLPARRLFSKRTDSRGAWYRRIIESVRIKSSKGEENGRAKPRARATESMQ